MRFSIFSVFLMLFAIGCGEQVTSDPSNTAEKVTKKVTNNSPEYTIIAVEQPESGWGYQILQDGKLAIDQKHIPAIQGYKTFSTKEKAEITANFIVGKMEKGIFPPTVSEEELDSLDVF